MLSGLASNMIDIKYKQGDQACQYGKVESRAFVPNYS